MRFMLLTEIAEGKQSWKSRFCLASFYGLRRSEVLGLKWDAIDFEANTLKSSNIVTQASIDGKGSGAGRPCKNEVQPATFRPCAAHPVTALAAVMLKGQQETRLAACAVKSWANSPGLSGLFCVWTKWEHHPAPTMFPSSSPKLLTVCVLSASTTWCHQLRWPSSV